MYYIYKYHNIFDITIMEYDYIKKEKNTIPYGFKSSITLYKKLSIYKSKTNS